METLKTVAILLGGFGMGLLLVANAVFALVSPTAWIHFRWHGFPVRWRSFKEEDLNSFGGRFKIFFFSSVVLTSGFAVLLLTGWGLAHRLF
jgi:hypothetical protein